MEELLRMWRGREIKVVGAATAKLREPKHVRTRGTANKLQSDVVYWPALAVSGVAHLAATDCPNAQTLNPQ